MSQVQHCKGIDFRRKKKEEQEETKIEKRIAKGFVFEEIETQTTDENKQLVYIFFHTHIISDAGERQQLSAAESGQTPRFLSVTRLSRSPKYATTSW